MTVEEFPSDGDEDLDILAALSGIPRGHLEELRRGVAAPDPAHLTALRRVLGAERASEYASHVVPKPISVITQVGDVPEGCELRPGTPVEDLRRGDWLVYRNSSTQPGTRWVRVESTHRNGFMITLEVLTETGPEYLTSPGERPAMVATPIEETSSDE